MKATSFMSEHTAEYALVPDLVAQLGDRFPKIVPVYFWATREGGRVGRESISDHAVRVVAAFARRPKVLGPGDERILVKINDILFAAAEAGGEVGIPVVAGVPLVNTLADFSTGVPCSWFHVSATSHHPTADQEFLLALSEQPCRPALPQGVAGPLTQAELVDVAESCCHELDWMRAVDGMRHVKSAGGFQHPIFGGVYRPFFLVISSNDGDAPTR
jgi:hypothetical protein